MDTAPQPTDDDDALNALLERARLFILDMILYIDAIAKRLGSVPLSAALVRQLTRRALLPAEAALRRVILILAADLPTECLSPAPSAAAGPARRQSGNVSKKPPAPRAPLFRMSEPQPGPKKSPQAGDLPEHLRPRITALTDAVLYASPPAPITSAPPRDPAAAFCRRLQALHSAFDNPYREAKRWLRRQAAAAAPAKSPLAPKIPGARKSLGDAPVSLLRELTKVALRAPALNTS